VPSVLVPGFSVRQHGFPFPNSFPDGTPVVSVPTPFGAVNFGNAGVGVCGGMVYAAADFFYYGRPVPPEPTKPVFHYLCRRLLDSFNFPFGWLKYWDWQVRPDVTALTARDWPKLKAELDAGRLCPIGLCKVHSWDPRRLGQNHQVLAYGYDTGETANDVTVHLYDPNYPADAVQLRANLGEPGRLVHHSFEGDSVRGFFPTDYRRPADPPVFDTASS
jgi:hypothetical protein